MKLVDLTGCLVDHLRGTIPSPHASGNWIYSDYPRTDATFPRISVTQTSGILEQIGIGEKVSEAYFGKLANMDYDIDIWVKVNDKTTYFGNVYVGTKLRDLYTDLIIDTLNKNKTSFKTNYEVLDIEILSVVSSPLDEETQLHRKTITVRLSFVWEW